MSTKDRIARRVALELHDGDVVNLGIGLPTLVSNYLPPGVEVILQSENGMLNMGQAVPEDQADPDITNAGAKFVSILPGGCFFDSTMSFCIIRGGHVDVTVLGALEVDQEGNLANWVIPGQMVPGMGGAMDLVTGAKKVIVATEHVNKNGKSKVLKRCSLPLTAQQKVNLIVTDLAVMEVTPQGLVVKELAPGVTPQALKEATEADLIMHEDLLVQALA